jgi:hypothetical protein
VSTCSFCLPCAHGALSTVLSSDRSDRLASSVVLKTQVRPSKPHAGPMFYMEKPPIILRLLRSQICQSSKIPSLHGGLHGHYLGLLRQAVQVAPSKGTRLANVCRVDFHCGRLLWLLLGLIRCEIERQAKIETLYCCSTASRRMPSSRTTPWQLEVLREGLGRWNFLR